MPDLHDQRASAVELQPRDLSLIRFALYRLMKRAYWLANAAAQDKSGRYFKPGAAEAFLKDAKDAEALLGRLKSAAAGEPTPCDAKRMKFAHGSPERIALDRLYNEEITVAKCIELLHEAGAVAGEPTSTKEER